MLLSPDVAKMWLSKRRTGPQTGLKSSTLASDDNWVNEALNLDDFNRRLLTKHRISDQRQYLCYFF
jgi:hypothetical protein